MEGNTSGVKEGLRGTIDGRIDYMSEVVDKNSKDLRLAEQADNMDFAGRQRCN